MIDLDQTRTARPPTQWAGELVRQRLVEAFAIERRMPGQHFATIMSAWPATPVHEFTDMLHWNNEHDGARERIWQSWTKARGVYSFEVSRMEQSFDWLQSLPDGERRCLAAWALAKSRNIPVRKMLRRRNWHPTTFYRRVDQAAVRIADALNAKGVQVR